MCVDSGFRVTRAEAPCVMLLVVVSLRCCWVSGLAGTPCTALSTLPLKLALPVPARQPWTVLAHVWSVGGAGDVGQVPGDLSAPGPTCERDVAAPARCCEDTGAHTGGSEGSELALVRV